MFPFAERTLGSLLRSDVKSVSALAHKLIPNNYQYPKGTFRNVHVGALQFNVDISDYVGHYIYFGFPDSGLNKLLELSRNAMTIFDIGANIGYTGLRLKCSSNSSSEVFAFEPDPHNFRELKKNASLNPDFPIHILQNGLGNVRGEFKLVIENPGNRGMNKIRNNANDGFETISVITLDDFVREKKISKADLIKIDTEGFEYNILMGARDVITRDKPTLFIELDDENLKLQNASASELVSFLEQHYSRIFNVETEKIIRSADDFKNCHYDIIATNN